MNHTLPLTYLHLLFWRHVKTGLKVLAGLDVVGLISPAVWQPTPVERLRVRQLMSPLTPSFLLHRAVAARVFAPSPLIVVYLRVAASAVTAESPWPGIGNLTGPRPCLYAMWPHVAIAMTW